MEHTAIIVESNLVNRRKLADDLRAEGSAAVLEAMSCSHGLELLSSVRSADTCLLGPRLRLRSATQFLRSGQLIVEKRTTPCSFLALVPEHAPPEYRHALREAGANGILAGSVGETNFSELVRRAVAREIPSLAQDLGALHPFGGQHSVETLNVVPLVPEQHRYTTARMTEVLLQLADRLSHLALEIDRGRFQVRKNGVPSLATADAIRISLEAAFPRTSDVAEIGSPGHQFIDAIIRWFELRPRVSRDEANELLRRTLIARMHA